MGTHPNMEQQADRGPVGPLHVVQGQDQGMPIRHGAQQVGGLLEEQALLQVSGTSTWPLGERLQSFQVVDAVRQSSRCPGEQPRAGQDSPDQ